MRLRIIVPSTEHLATAGVRIRYRRVEGPLAALGHQLTLERIDEAAIAPAGTPEVILLSKCHDARSLLLAREARAAGHHVGADFFDDYYSRDGDSRFVHFREWLRTIAPDLTFALCSTPPMRASISTLLPDLPCHVMNDPHGGLDPALIADRVEAKLQRLAATRTIEAGWFGIGDNPNFSVGLGDLVAFSDALVRMGKGGYRLRLSILTNRRALTPAGLELLNRLPVPFRVEEWSEAAEQQLTGESCFCFLPVNAQPFSAVKSLNRGVTALTAGTQVLSAGYPLYDSLGEFVYRDPASLLADLVRGEPKLRRDTMPGFITLIGSIADPDNEAARLARFLAGLAAPGQRPPWDSLAVLHGRQSFAAVVESARRRGHVNGAGPWPPPGNAIVDFRVIRHPDDGRPIVQLSEQAVQRLDPALRESVARFRPARGAEVPFLRLDSAPLDAIGFPGGARLEHDSVLLAAYEPAMDAMAELAARLFGVKAVIHSEYASPFWREPRTRAAGR
jgi:hypothetical protein